MVVTGAAVDDFSVTISVVELSVAVETAATDVVVSCWEIIGSAVDVCAIDVVASSWLVVGGIKVVVVNAGSLVDDCTIGVVTSSTLVVGGLKVVVVSAIIVVSSSVIDVVSSEVSTSDVAALKKGFCKVNFSKLFKMDSNPFLNDQLFCILNIPRRLKLDNCKKSLNLRTFYVLKHILNLMFFEQF